MYNWTCYWLLLYFCISVTYTISSSITQSPGLIHVSVGNTVELKCKFDLPVKYCYSTTLYKMNLQTGELTAQGSSSITEQDKKTCILEIKIVTLKDSGLYYCASPYSSMILMGNGTKIIVTDHVDDSEPKLSILYSPDDTDASAVLLQCLVTGVAPSQVRVFWMIGQKERAGWTEPAWTNNTDSATQFTRAHLSVSAEEWTRGDKIQCVVEYNGKNVSKILIKWDHLGSKQICLGLLLWGCGTAVLTIVVTIIISVSLYREMHVTKTSRGLTRKDAHRKSPYYGKQSTLPEESPSAMYYSEGLISTSP